MSVINTSIDSTTQILTIEVKDGEKVVGKLVVDPKDFSQGICNYAMAHGFKQRLGDAAALERDRTTGLSATPQEKFEAMKEVYEHLQAANTAEEWNRKPQKGGVNAGLLLEALIRVTGQSVEDCRAAMGGWNEKEKDAMRQDPAIAPVIEQIKKERVKPVTGVDTKALLGRLIKAEPAQEA